MKVISLWQPWASLVVLGHKTIETRSWPAPSSLIGKVIGIAATKVIKPEERQAFADPLFQEHYRPLGLPGLEELPRGGIIGSALLHSCEVMTDELIEDLTEEE